jgi:hypothetical protein
LTGFHGSADVYGTRPSALTRRLLGWLSASGIALVGLCVLAFWVMSVLHGRADRARERACAATHYPSTVHWEHGYGAVLPLGAVAVAVLALVLSLIVVIARASAPWSRALSSIALIFGGLALLLSLLVAHDYFAYPGGDISTVGSSRLRLRERGAPWREHGGARAHPSRSAPEIPDAHTPRPLCHTPCPLCHKYPHASERANAWGYLWQRRVWGALPGARVSRRGA